MPVCVCEGCGKEYSKGGLNSHRKTCISYQEWAKQLPFSCACGFHFATERSLRSHKKGCGKAERLRLGGRKCVCGQTYWSVSEHRKTCPGAPEESSSLVVLKDPPPGFCACGRDFSASNQRSTLHKHQQGCSAWHVWQKTLPVKCEGCGLGFKDQFSKRSHAQLCSDWQRWKQIKDEKEKKFPCPSCGMLFRGLKLGLHVNSCSGPWTKRDWARQHRRSKSKRLGLMNQKFREGADFVTCLLCGDRFRSLSFHLTSQHGIDTVEYRCRFGGASVSGNTQAKRKATMMDRYGYPTLLQHPVLSKQIQEKRKATCRKRYGGDSPFSSNLTRPPKKNRLESTVEMISPKNVIYVGDFRYWIQCKDVTGKWINRNPDFVVYDKDKMDILYSGVVPNKIRTWKIVEVLGDYFHGPKLKGLDRAAYTAMRIAEYASVKVHCLILWESEIKDDLEAVRARLSAFAEENPVCLNSDSVIGVPPSKFDFDRYYKRKLWADGLVEGKDFVSCPICVASDSEKEYRALRLADHLKLVHGLSRAEFEKQFPGSPIVAPVVYEKRSKTVKALYGVDNVFQAESIKEKSRETVRAEYGVDHSSQIPSVVRQRAMTNLSRYGHENPFGGEAVQEKIRKTMTERHGAPNPQQVPEIRARTLETCKDLYGDEFFFRTEEFRKKFREVSQERFGADHPMQSDEGKALCVKGCQEHLGVDNPFLVPDIFKKSYETNLANHGSKHSQQCKEVLKKARQTWMERIGVDNPSKSEEVRARMRATWMEKYGVDHPFKTEMVRQKLREAFIKAYGVPFFPSSAFFKQNRPNKLEKKFDALSPVNVVYAGDGSYWIKHTGATNSRNPDFVILDQDQLESWKWDGLEQAPHLGYCRNPRCLLART
jgi:predicted transcriptional regulator